MNYFIKNIHINKLFHLENIDIPIVNEKYPHLIITGKNGSGKTVLLNAITESFNNLLREPGLNILKELFSGKINVQFCDEKSIIEKYDHHNFIIAFYQAYRRIKMIEPMSPTKPVILHVGIRDTSTDKFLAFLSDLKIQEALARNEKQFDDADEINAWFVDFEKLLQQIFQDDNLKLEFNYKDYSFWICTEGKKFKFTQLSDGFAAALDIVADLILKMQGNNSLTRVYQKEGIVLIDEIETHLHLGLQKIIMPLLTRVFPNIQFIVTTHSPFVLSSMPNAVAYDLENKEILEDLTEYSYEALAEGYFGVKTEASYMEMQLHTFKKLLEKDCLSNAERIELKQLKSDFEKIPETVSPLVVGEFRRLLIQYTEKLKELSI